MDYAERIKLENYLLNFGMTFVSCLAFFVSQSVDFITIGFKYFVYIKMQLLDSNIELHIKPSSQRKELLIIWIISYKIYNHL